MQRDNFITSTATMSKIESNFGIGKILIVESIPEREPQTGKKLYDELVYLEKVYQTGLLIECEKVDTSKQLLDCLDKLFNGVISNHRIPLLHIEAHGGPDVLQLSSGNVIYWAELIEPFTKINIAAHNNFVVVVSACFGAHVLSTIRLGEMVRSPIFAAIGSWGKANPIELGLGYQAFYHKVFEAKEINKAIDSLNEKRLDTTKSFQILSAQNLFYQACSILMKERNSIHEIGNRARRINELIKSDPRTKDLPQETQNAILIDATNHEPLPVIDQLYSKFMMTDLFPENSKRFRFDKSKIEPN